MRRAVLAVRALGPIDRKSIGRDPLLRWLVLLPLFFALAMRWLALPLVRRLGEMVGLDLMPFYPPILGYALLTLVPVLTGMVVGFLLLDQRDDGTLTALRVTPLPLSEYLAYRLAVPMLASTGTTVVLLPLAGLGEVGVAGLVVAALGAAPLAPLFALFLAVFAANKVQGFALVKVSSVLLVPPLIAFFVRSGWQWAFGVVPTFWSAKLYWALRSGGANAWVYLVLGVVYQSFLLALLLRRFARATGH